MIGPFLYIVVIQYLKGDQKEEHTVSVEAYSLQEASMQVLIELDAEHDFTARGYTPKLLKVGPDTTKIRKHVDDMLADLSQQMLKKNHK